MFIISIKGDLLCLVPNPVHSGASSGGLQFKVIFIYVMFVQQLRYFSSL